MAKKRRKRRLGRILLILILIAAALGLAGYAVFDHYFSLLKRVPDSTSPESLAAEEVPEPLLLEEEPHATPAPTSTPDPDATARPADVYHMLLLGVDSRYNTYNTRTDAMMMVSINKDNKEILLTSFLRDTYLYIPNWGYQRLNAANVVGGPEKTIDTISYHYGVKADNYLFVNFYSFVDAIDTVGGIDITLSDLEVSYINARSGYPLAYQATGIYHLNGDQALSFCRNRSIGSDLRRTEQQRRVITSLWSKAKTMSLRELSDTAETLLSQVVTDLDRKTFLYLLTLVPTLKDYTISQQQIPADGTFSFANIGGASVLEVDFEANREILQKYLYED